MIQVKICGITNEEDALYAAGAGAAALGFIFYPASPRYISPDDVKIIADRLPADLVRVGVFVNEEADKVKNIFDYCGLDMLQFHGDETPEYCRQFPARQIIKALELKKDEDLKTALRFDVTAILADSRQAGLYGGTGRKSNWAVAGLLELPLILSGGLNEDNVRDALREVRPAALDINSGVEKNPGRKDSQKIARVMQVIKTEDTLTPAPSIFVRREKI
jgi:phosphoribosylanthranilate isomerase